MSTPTTFRTMIDVQPPKDSSKYSFEKKKKLVKKYIHWILNKDCDYHQYSCSYGYKCRFKHSGSTEYQEQIEYWFSVALEKQEQEQEQERLCLEEQQKQQQAKDQEEQDQCLDVIEEEKTFQQELETTCHELELHEATLKTQEEMVSSFLELGFDSITAVKMMDAAMSVVGF